STRLMNSSNTQSREALETSSYLPATGSAQYMKPSTNLSSDGHPANCPLTLASMACDALFSLYAGCRKNSRAASIGETSAGRGEIACGGREPKIAGSLLACTGKIQGPTNDSGNSMKGSRLLTPVRRDCGWPCGNGQRRNLTM